MNMLKEVKNFWDARPCNVRHSQAEIGSKQYYSEVAARRYYVEPHIKNFMGDFKDGRVLDIGCGVGTDSLMFAARGCKVTGVDISQNSLDIAKGGAKAMKLGRKTRFIRADIEHLSKYVKPKPYDLIWSFGVLHHTPHSEKAVKEIKKFCNKNTVVKVMLYHKHSWKAFWLWLRDRSFTNSEAQQSSPVTHAYSKKEAKDLFKDFRILDMKVDFIFPWKVDKYINYEYAHPWYWPILKHFQKWIGWHLLLTMKIKNEKANN